MRSLQEQISKLYYSHGLYVASHPTCVISVVICLILFFCYPLRYIPLPQNAPVDYITYPQDEQSEVRRGPGGSKPLAYIVQIVMRAAVHPWSRDGSMVPLDALRGPLLESFEIVRQVEATQTRNGSRVLADICLQVGEPVYLPRADKAMEKSGWGWKDISEELAQAGSFGFTPDTRTSPLPSYSCLVTAPDNLWNKKEAWYRQDKHVVPTIYSQGRGHLKDILFGLPWKETGVSRFMIRAVQRVITYSVTLVLREYDPEFISEITARLRHHYPYTEQVVPAEKADRGPATVVVYREKDYIGENKTLAMAYIVLLLYVYFSVRKIEMVKSKWGLAFSACFTVVASLLMSIGICVYFGLTPTLNGSEIFPYLVVLIGLENVLVITKSVVATPVELPVKYRVAQGLSKEGWAITKHLLGELSLLAIGFLTFNPAIQEFCLFALVGFTTDFFLQMFFFVTVLSIDIRRMELSEVAPPQGSSMLGGTPMSDGVQTSSQPQTSHYVASAAAAAAAKFSRRSPSVSLTSSSRPGHHRRTASDVNIAAYFNGEKDPQFAEFVPRRLRFLCYWAQTRVFHRVFKFVLICWILVIVYTTGIYKPFLDILTDFTSGASARDLPSLLATMTPLDSSVWMVMAYYHWPILFRYYNISLSGRHITVMPPIYLAHIISPEAAIGLRPSSPASGSAIGGTPKPAAEPESWVGSSTLAGWADLGLTATLFFTCLLGVTAVLTTTYLSMCVFAWLTNKHRPGVREAKVVPLVVPCHPLSLSVERWAAKGAHVGVSFLDSHVSLVRADLGQLVMSLRPPPHDSDAAVWALAVAPDGTLLTGLASGIVEAWSERADVAGVAGSLQLIEGHGSCLSSVRCASENDQTPCGVLELSEVIGGQPGEGPVRLYAGTVSGAICELVLRSCTVGQRDYRYGLVQLTRRVRAHHLAISALVASPSGHLVSGSIDFTVRVFHSGTLVAGKTTFDHQAEITCLHLAGSVLISGAADGGLHALDLNTGRRLLGRCSAANRVHMAPVCTLAASPAASNRFPRDPLNPDLSRLLVSGDRAGRVCLWRCGRERPLRTFQANALELCPLATVVLPKFLVFNDVDDDQLSLLVHNFQSNRAAVRIKLQKRYLPVHLHSPVVPVACLDERYLLCFADQCVLVFPCSAIR